MEEPKMTKEDFNSIGISLEVDPTAKYGVRVYNRFNNERKINLQNGSPTIHIQCYSFSKMFSLPRLVYEYFIGELPERCKLSFKDGNNNNCSPDNLFIWGYEHNPELTEKVIQKRNVELREKAEELDRKFRCWKYD